MWSRTSGLYDFKVKRLYLPKLIQQCGYTALFHYHKQYDTTPNILVELHAVLSLESYIVNHSAIIDLLSLASKWS